MRVRVRDVEVEFPYETPYASQYALMNKALAAMAAGENALLESPTGSGKSLALLCSSMAFQQERDRVEQKVYEEEMEKHRIDTRRSFPSKRAVPTVLFCSRTHEQIKQIVSELRRTGYRPKMTILASRSYYCVHPQLKPVLNKNEECEHLLKERKCSFYRHADRISESMQRKEDVWDIEDLVKLGKKEKGCPYFASRDMMKPAEVVFAPYNYVLDPSIRESMDINLKNRIIIIDEAHNIEDVCRSAATREFGLKDLMSCRDELGNMAFEAVVEHGTSLKYGLQIVTKLHCWIHERMEAKKVVVGFEKECIVVEKAELDHFWHDIGVTDSTYVNALHALSLIKSMAKEEDYTRQQQHTEPTYESTSKVLSGPSSHLLGNLSIIIKYFFDPVYCAQSDQAYRLVLTKSARREETSISAKFVCLNPSVAFYDLASESRSILLTSGTLSPLASFESELGVAFEHKIEAPHVIDRQQVMVRSVCVGPAGLKMRSTFRYAEKLAFQDELGQLVLRVFDQMQRGGALLFLTSYTLMEKLERRWKEIKLWSPSASTLVLFEPRSMSTFQRSIAAFKDHLDASSSHKALFVAVCRGKMSEGIDFADHYARVVLVVGIPFPNAQDVQVRLKKTHNDTQHRKTKNRISGSQWYALQAYKALNQAIGRCIRHRKDYGAILLIDDRFKERSTVQNISRWIRNMMMTDPKAIVNSQSQFECMLNDMETFFDTMEKRVNIISDAEAENSPVPRSVLSLISADTSDGEDFQSPIAKRRRPIQ